MMVGADVTRIASYSVEDDRRDETAYLARAFLLGVEDYDVRLSLPEQGIEVEINAELCLIFADRLSSLAHHGSVTDIVIRRYIASRSGRNGTIDRLGAASKDFVMSGYRLRLTQQGEASLILKCLTLVLTGEAIGEVRVLDTPEPFSPVPMGRNAAFVADGALRAISESRLTTILTVAPEERMTWRQARYLTLRHHDQPPSDPSDPWRHYLSLGMFSYGWICHVLEEVGVPLDRFAAFPANALAGSVSVSGDVAEIPAVA